MGVEASATARCVPHPPGQAARREGRAGLGAEALLTASICTCLARVTCSLCYFYTWPSHRLWPGSSPREGTTAAQGLACPCTCRVNGDRKFLPSLATREQRGQDEVWVATCFCELSAPDPGSMRRPAQHHSCCPRLPGNHGSWGLSLLPARQKAPDPCSVTQPAGSASCLL